jgi:hypothetical protein
MSDRMSVICSTRGGGEKYTHFYSESMKEREHFADISVDGMRI